MRERSDIFDALPTVKNDLEVWRQNALAQLIRNRCLDSVTVTEGELKDYYMNMNASKEASEKVQLSIIASTNVDTMMAVLDSVRAGKKFELYAKRYPQSEFTTTALMPVSYFTPFYPALLTSKVKDILGPVKAANTYYLAKVVRKKQIDSLFIKPYEKVKNQVMEIYKDKQLTKYFNAKTAELAGKYGVKIYADIVKKLEINPIPTFVYRFIGFGGTIAAAPLTTPMYNWYKEYQKKKQFESLIQLRRFRITYAIWSFHHNHFFQQYNFRC